MDLAQLAAMGTVIIAGFFRGVTGFGGAMLMTPILSVLLGPIDAVAIALLLETGAALVMFANVLPKVQWRVVGYLSMPAVLTVPMGGYFLMTIDPLVARKFISGVVVACSSMLLLGLKYDGSPRPATSILLGSIAGALVGATSIGAPPVILYLLSGPEPARVIRANLTVFITTMSFLGLMVLLASGAVSTGSSLWAVFLIIPFLLSTWIGTKLFVHMPDIGVRRIALGIMFLVGVFGLCA